MYNLKTVIVCVSRRELEFKNVNTILEVDLSCK